MQRLAFAMLLSLGMTGFVQASDESEWSQAMQIPCHATLTASECRAHYDLLGRLPEGAEREAYLADHFAMIEDRSQACGCSMKQNNVGMLD